MKKVAIIGKGTAGAISALNLYKQIGAEVELEWYFDPTIPTQAVGEGSTLDLPQTLYRSMEFNHQDLTSIEGTIKTGILKENWGENGSNFMHSFKPPSVAYHFNARGIQNYIHEFLKGKVNIVEQNVTSEDIDASYVMDCTGRPSSYTDEFQLMNDSIVVNAVHVNQCAWPEGVPTFNYTGAIARPYGWVFVIPLTNRCSIGYLYNKNINTLEEVKQDIQEVISRFGVLSTSTNNSFQFDSYYRLKNFTDRVCYNGNSSFFLEPLEATSIKTMIDISYWARDIIRGITNPHRVSCDYISNILGTENMLTVHYFSGSKFKSDFWDYATHVSEERMRKLVKNDPNFRTVLNRTRLKNSPLDWDLNRDGLINYGTWGPESWISNIRGLGVQEKLERFGF